MASPETGSEFRIFKVWVPYLAKAPEMAWADVKVTATQTRITRASDRGAWGFKTLLRGVYARSEADAWASYAEQMRGRIRHAEQDIAECREHLALAEALARGPAAPPRRSADGGS